MIGGNLGELVVQRRKLLVGRRAVHTDHEHLVDPSDRVVVAIEAEHFFRGDVDVVCAQDGQLIIGEVKASMALFRQADFAIMERIARDIAPSEVIFSALEPGPPNARIQSMIANMNVALAKVGTTARWLQLPDYIFTSGGGHFTM